MNDPLKGATCTGADLNLFFPTSAAAADQVIYDYCSVCPVVAACEKLGKSIPGVVGVWGGYWHTRERGPAVDVASGTRKAPRERRRSRVYLVEQGWTFGQIAHHEGTTYEAVQRWWYRRQKRLQQAATA